MLKLCLRSTDKENMNAPKFMMMNILRIITPEEIGEITTKHNGGKFLSLTDLIDERIEKNILRNFQEDAAPVLHDAKILPFKKPSDEDNEGNEISSQDTDTKFDPNEDVTEEAVSLTAMLDEDHQSTTKEDEVTEKSHREDENMSSFILIEKERFKRSQQVLKKKEIMDLYQQTARVEVEQIKHANQNLASSGLDGVLINKKQY